MDLVLKGRGTRITNRIRETTQHKLSPLPRLEPRLTRIEVEIIKERTDHHLARRLEASAVIPRKVFRARANGPNVETALDQLVQRLGRQIRDHHGRKRTRLLAGSNRLQSAPPGSGATKQGE